MNVKSFGINKALPAFVTIMFQQRFLSPTLTSLARDDPAIGKYRIAEKFAVKNKLKLSAWH